MKKLFTYLIISLFLVLSINLVSAIGENHSLVMPTATTIFPVTYPSGVLVNVTANTTIYTVTKHPLSNATVASIYIRTSSATGALLANATFVGDNATFSPAIAVNTTTRDYLVVTSSGGAETYNTTQNATIPPFPISNPQLTTNWSVRLNVVGGEFNDQTENILYIFTSNLSRITVTSLHPATNQNFTAQSVYFTVNASTSDGFISVTNVSLLINGTVNQTNTSQFNGVYNFSVAMPYGFWNYSFRSYGNDTTIYNSINGTLNFTVIPVNYNSFTFNASSAETANESFYTNITTNGTTPSSAYFVYNGTTYSATITTAGSFYNLSRTINIPLQNTTKNFTFIATLAGVNYTSSIQSQIILDTVFALCNATYTNDFLNITFKDEVSSAYINASITSGEFVYYLGSGSVNKTLSYNSAGVNNYNYTFCAIPTSRNFNVLPEVTYKQGADYPQRTWEPTVQSYNSSVFEQILYLLSSSDGIFVTFQVINGADEVLMGVFSNASRDFSGIATLVGSGTTDSAGTITYWLNPDISHTFYFVLSGYDTFVTTLFPTQTSYTVNMGGAGQNTTTFDYNRGITYNITPTDNSLSNATVYNFSFTLASSYWNIQQFGFDLVDENGTRLAAANSTSNGGVVYVAYNTTNYSKISMNYFWLANSTYSNLTYTWFVYDNAGTGFGLNTFFTRLRTYATAGMFGLDNFGLALISFTLIFVGTGALSYKFGLTSPAAIAGFMFFLTLFLNVGVDIIPIGYSPLQYFPSIAMGIIFAGVLFKEAIN